MIDTAAEISSGRVSMFEVTKAAMDRIDALNPHINALVTKTYDYGVRQIALRTRQASCWCALHAQGSKFTRRCADNTWIKAFQ